MGLRCPAAKAALFALQEDDLASRTIRMYKGQIAAFISSNQRAPRARDFGKKEKGLSSLERFRRATGEKYVSRILLRLGYNGIELVTPEIIKSELDAFAFRHGHYPMEGDFTAANKLRPLKTYAAILGCDISYREVNRVLGVDAFAPLRKTAARELQAFAERTERVPVRRDFGRTSLHPLAVYLAVFRASTYEEVLKAANFVL